VRLSVYLHPFSHSRSLTHPLSPPSTGPPPILSVSLGLPASTHNHLIQAEVSGFRASCDVMIYINLPAALSAGIAFFRSANGVILTEGGVGGHAMPVRARQ
jgi:hypothetical protein